MRKVHSSDDFVSQITEDRNWRIREMSDLKTATKRADPQLRTVLLRSMVTICYAHWEGYVKFSSHLYLKHVARKRLRFAELERHFLHTHYLPKVSASHISNLALLDRCAIIDGIIGSSTERFAVFDSKVISTGSNLGIKQLKEICLICGVSGALFDDHAHFIDKTLRERRNFIAHGQETLIGFEEVDSLPDTTVDLMRAFGNELENLVELQRYRSKSANHL